MLGHSALAQDPISSIPLGGAAAAPSTLGAMVTNAYAPQLLAITGFGLIFAALPTPPAASAPLKLIAVSQQDYRDPAGPRLFPSVRTPLVTAAVPTVILVLPQDYRDPAGPLIILSTRSGQTPPIIPTVSNALGPQLLDFTQQGWLRTPLVGSKPVIGARVTNATAPQLIDLTPPSRSWGPLATRQGPVPPITQAAPEQRDLSLAAQLFQPFTSGQGAVPALISGAPQLDPTQLAPLIFLSPPAAAITPNPVATFFAIPPQTEDRPTREIYRSVVAGQPPPAVPQLIAAPQPRDLTQQALVYGPAIGQPLPFPLIVAAPQQIDLTVPAKLIPVSTTPPAVVGVIVAPLPSVFPQPDLSINYSVLWTPSTFSTGLPVVEEVRRGGDAPRRKHRVVGRDRGFDEAAALRKREAEDVLLEEIRALYRKLVHGEDTELADRTEEILAPLVPEILEPTEKAPSEDRLKELRRARVELRAAALTLDRITANRDAEIALRFVNTEFEVRRAAGVARHRAEYLRRVQLILQAI